MRLTRRTFPAFVLLSAALAFGLALLSPSTGAEDTPPPAPTDDVGNEVPPSAPETAPIGAEANPLAPSADTPPPAPEPPPEPTPEPPPSDPAPLASETAAEKPKIDPRIPMYQQIRPRWGVSMTGALRALGKNPAIPGFDGSRTTDPSSVRAIRMQVEYQPTAVQKFGVLGAGPSFTIFPITPAGSLTRTFAGLWSVGGQVRYQLRLLREQPLVPYAGYGAEALSYTLSTGPRGRFTVKGPFLGGMFLLNLVDPGAAAEFYVNYEVTRSYLVVELRTMDGSDGTITLSGQSLYFGLRCEL